MNTQSKIKELIEKYNKLASENSSIDERNIFYNSVKDLESLLEPEQKACEHKNQEKSFVGGGLSNAYKVHCIDCGSLIYWRDHE